MIVDKSIFTIVIPALNEAKYLPELLDNLVVQTRKNFTVVVVDGGSTDKTVSVVHSYQEKLPLQIITTKQANVSIQRNAGAETAQTSWVLFMDADSRIPPYFMEGVTYQTRKNPQVDMWTCLSKPETNTPMDHIINIGINLTLLATQGTAKTVTPGAMLGCKTNVFKKFTFNPELRLSEDSELIRQALNAGFRYEVFKDPTYIFNLRRFRKEGMLKMLAIDAKTTYAELKNQYLSEDDLGYYMLGGGYYESAPKEAKPSALKLSQQQLKRMQAFFNQVTGSSEKKK